MSEFSRCVNCNDKLAPQCEIVRQLLGYVMPEVDGPDTITDEDDDFMGSYRPARHWLAVQVLKREELNCTEFQLDAEALRARTPWPISLESLRDEAAGE